MYFALDGRSVQSFMQMNALKFAEPLKENVHYLIGNDAEKWCKLCVLKLVIEEYDFKLSGLVNTHKQSFELCSWRWHSNSRA